MAPDKTAVVETAESILAEALNKNVRGFGFGGYDTMLEAREALLEAGVAPKERVPVGTALSSEDAASYALYLLNRAKTRKENESGYAGYDTMLEARRSLISAKENVSPVDLVGAERVKPH